MTNHWIDIKNANCIFIIGANPCENHPGVMRWINQAVDNGAKVIVADPRKTRTATMADMHLQIRPGTDIALIYGMLNHLLLGSPTGLSGDMATKANIESYLTKTITNRVFRADNGSNATASVWPKYTDALFKVNAAGDDYQRENKYWSSKNVSNVPVVASGLTDPDCVYQKLLVNISGYTPAVAADICGIPAGQITAAAEMIAQNSTPFVRSNNKYGGDGATAVHPMATTLLYAMGATQHTYGSQIIRAYAIFQTMLGNMGRIGGGINAMRGIHNVQGSTDMGVLRHLIPGYSGPPATTLNGANGYIKYMNTKLFGEWYGTTLTTASADVGATGITVAQADTARMIKIATGNVLQLTNPTGGVETLTVDGSYVSGTAVPITGSLASAHVSGSTVVNNSYPDTTSTTKPKGLQQLGFDNMLHYWFSDASGVSGSAVNLFDYFPKGNGQDHVQMFKDMASGGTKMAVIWGQNPAVTEPNLTLVRSGLNNVDTLVVVDQFYTETAAMAETRAKPTYILPACSFAEAAGSQSNSGRWIQWREAAIPPKGGSRADLEILFQLAKALSVAGAFDHLDNITGNKYTALYGSASQYNYPATSWLATGGSYTTNIDALTENVYKQFCNRTDQSATNPTGCFGTLWIYRDAYNGAASPVNRAKSRSKTTDVTGSYYSGPGCYPNWGWAWLLNRRVFYNYSECGNDVGDVFVNADVVAQLFTSNATQAPKYGLHAYTYRYYRSLAETDDYMPTSGAVSGVFGGRFPKHWEPMESSRSDLVADAKYGRNNLASHIPGGYATRGVNGDSHEYTAADFTTYPLTLTTIRCTEHFQGGPTTRNIPWLNELVNEPWIELSEDDAATYGIKNGDVVEIKTKRTESLGTPWIGDFRAVVSTRVKAGVVAIPWHWGNKGLSTGPSANELTIEAGDANSQIPEYKICLCVIRKS